jgi:hypothetical protein
MLEIKESSTGAGDDVIRLRGNGNNADNTVLGALEWYNADSSGDQPGVVCRIEGVSGNSNGHMGEILFKTHDGSEGGEGSNPVERMRIDNSGDVGIGTASPSEKLDVVGNVTISGSLSKGSGSFKIDHPLPEMSDTHHLVHSFIEGPKADLIYRGSVALVDGAATVDLDAAATMTSGTWELLCRDPQVWVQNEDGWTQVCDMEEGMCGSLYQNVNLPEGPVQIELREDGTVVKHPLGDDARLAKRIMAILPTLTSDIAEDLLQRLVLVERILKEALE